jgi:hypothetical protein
MLVEYHSVGSDGVPEVVPYPVVHLLINLAADLVPPRTLPLLYQPTHIMSQILHQLNLVQLFGTQIPDEF